MSGVSLLLILSLVSVSVQSILRETGDHQGLGLLLHIFGQSCAAWFLQWGDKGEPLVSLLIAVLLAAPVLVLLHVQHLHHILAKLAFHCFHSGKA